MQSVPTYSLKMDNSSELEDYLQLTKTAGDSTGGLSEEKVLGIFQSELKEELVIQKKIVVEQLKN